MGERTGVGLVEVAILEALDSIGARLGRRYVKSSRVLDAVDQNFGLAPGYGYEILVDLVQPWKMPVLLVDGQGNFGSHGNDPPANFRYTEARLSSAGQAGHLSLAAECPQGRRRRLMETRCHGQSWPGAGQVSVGRTAPDAGDLPALRG